MKRPIRIALLVFTLALSGIVHAQSQLPEHPPFPYVKAYMSFLLPLVSVNKNETVTEFEKVTTIAFPVGLNVYYGPKFGFSFEISPSVQWSQQTDSAVKSKTSNLLIDPGPIFRFKHGFNIVARLAFETQGRYGFTPVFNKVYARTRDVDYWLSLSVPTRFGNNLPTSVGLSLQFGFTFN